MHKSQTQTHGRGRLCLWGAGSEVSQQSLTEADGGFGGCVKWLSWP